MATRSQRRTDRRTLSTRAAPPRTLPVATAFLLLIAVGFSAYANSMRGILVFDDEPSIAQNPHVRSLWPLSAAMAAPRDTTLAGRPIASLSFALNHALAPVAVRDIMAPDAGTSAEPFYSNILGYHVLNLVIHLAAGLALFGVVRRTLLTPRLQPLAGYAATALAAIIAALWLVHPLQTASVTYVVQRVESLMGMFYLLTMYCAIRAADADGDRVRWWSAAAVAACALGMGTKEVMVTAPLMVAVWYAIFAPEATARRRGLLGGLALTWIILAVIVAGKPRAFSVGFGFSEWPWWRYLLTQAGVILHYVRLAVVPWPLVLDYDWPPQSRLAIGGAQAAVLAAAATATAWGLLRRRPAAFAAAWFFVILAPTSSILPIVTEVAAEHRMYLPLAGIIALVVVALFALAGRLAAPRTAGHTTLLRAGTVAAVVVVALFVVMTRSRNADYHDYERIWSDTIAKRPRNARARNNFATSLMARGQYQEAAMHLQAAVEASPAFAEAHANLGVALAAQGKFDEAIAQLQRAIVFNPDYAAAYRNLGEVYGGQGRLAAAAAQYGKALDHDPDNVELLNRTAWILATARDGGTRDGAKALALAQRAVRLTARQDVVSLDSLAAALAEQGRFGEAGTVAVEALTLARTGADQAIVPELQARLNLYRSNRPFRQ